MANLNVTDIYKYGYGLLDLTKAELYSMDSFDFLEKVEGALLWHEYKLDEMLNNFAWFTANQMMSTGNMKKGTDAMKLKQGLYKSLEDIEEEQDSEESKADKAKKSAEDEKAKLIERFKLNK